MMKQFVFILIGFLFFAGATMAQNKAVIKAELLNFDFGTIAEEDGSASHSFAVKNTGTTPLVITKVTVSCGCTTPEWTQAPIAPGKTGEVKVTYDPKGRPGPFLKTVSVYSNGKEGPYMLAVKGNVTPKKPKPIIMYPYAIGDVKLHIKKILFSSIRTDETLGEKILIKNDGDAPAVIHVGKHPSFLTMEVRPETIPSGETGEITLLFDAHAVKRLGRIVMNVPITVTSGTKKPVEGTLPIAANIIEDMSRMTVAEKEQSPVIELKSDIVDFGTLKNAGGKASQLLEVINKGKTELLIRSIGSDDERIDLSGGRREIKPGGSAIFKITIRPKEVKANLETVITLVSNDPNSPVRLVKVTAKQ